MAGQQLARDEAGNVWDVSDPNNPQFVSAGQANPHPQVVVPAPPPKPDKPETTYRTLTPAEVKQHGLNPDHAWQMSSTGDFKDLGTTGNDDTSAAKKQSALEATRNLVQSIEKAKNLVTGYSTGFGGYLGQSIPAATQANQLDTVINQEIRGNIFKNWVDTMKAQSDNGGTGIGRIMQSEIPLVTGSLGALDPVKMGYQGTLDSLNQIEQRVLRSAATLNGENADDQKVIDKYRQQFAIVPGAKQTPPSVGGGGNGNPPSPHDYSGMTGGPSASLVTGGVRNQYDPVMANALTAFIRHGAPYETAATYAQSHGFDAPDPNAYAQAVQFAREHHGATNVQANRQVATTLGERLSSSPLAAGFAGAVSGGTAGLSDVAGRSLVGPQWDANRAALAATNPTADLLGNVAGGAAGMFGAGGLGANLLRAGVKGGLGRRALALAVKNPIAAGILGDTAYGGVYGASENPDNPLAGAGVGAIGGAVGGVAGNALAKGTGAVLEGVTNPAVQRLRAAGIPLTAGEALGGGFKKAQDAMTSVFGPGNMVARRYADGREALNRVAINQAGQGIGANINLVGQPGIDALRTATGNAYDRALSPVSVDLTTPSAMGDITNAVRSAATIPNADSASDIATGALRNYIWNPAVGGVMSGRDFQQGYRGLARTANKASDRIYGHEIGQALGQGKEALVNALQAQNPGAYEQFARANAANRQLNILADAVNSAKNQVDTGNPLFTPAQLGTAATANAKKYNGNIAAASGNRPFNQLINDAQQVMSSKLGESGTVPRALVTGSIMSGGGMFGNHVDGGRGAAEGALAPLTLLTLLGTRQGQRLLTGALMNRTVADKVAGRYLGRNPQIGGDILTAAGIPLLSGP